MRIEFQSSPARGGGCNLRPRTSTRGSICGACFNPHPPVGAGATAGSGSRHLDRWRFQSSPARGGGCNEDLRRGRAGGSPAVSILTRPWGRVQRATRAADARLQQVSILTRPWGRVQHQLRLRAYLQSRDVVSILTRPWGRVQRKEGERLVVVLVFQSSPARGGGCNCACDWR